LNSRDSGMPPTGAASPTNLALPYSSLTVAPEGAATVCAAAYSGVACSGVAWSGPG
jgi:hypothetical protein